MPFSRAAGSSRRTTWSRVLGEIEFQPLEGQLARFDLGQVEDVVDQSPQGLRRGLDDIQGLAEIGGEVGGEEQLRHADHAVQGSADLVAHVGQELALGAARRLGRHEAPPRLLLQRGVLDDESHLARDGGGHLHLERLDRAGPRPHVVERHGTDHLVLPDQRHHQELAQAERPEILRHPGGLGLVDDDGGARADGLGEGRELRPPARRRAP